MDGIHLIVLKRSLRTSLVTVSAAMLFGCAAINAPLTSDQTILDDTAALLGLQPSNVVISDKRSESGTTYYTATTTNGIVYLCTMEGGTVLTMGVHNPPVCHKKGT